MSVEELKIEVPCQKYRISRAKRIKRARLRAGLTKAKLTEITGLNPNTYSGVEKGASDPRVSLLDKVAVATGSCPLWLMFGDEIIARREAMQTIMAWSKQMQITGEEKK